MNFWKRHIGDYLRDTAHLSLLEHGVYARLLDVYYTRESGIPDGQAERLVGARTDEERAAVHAVLREFFTQNPDGFLWVQDRCEREIAEASAKAERNREIGKMGGRPSGSSKKNPGKTDAEPTGKPSGFSLGSEDEPTKNPSQTPDSRLIPTTSAPVGAPADEPVDPVKALFDDGVQLLRDAGHGERQARALIGRWRKTASDEVVANAVARCRRESPTDPVSWLSAALTPYAQRKATALPGRDDYNDEGTSWATN